LQQNLRLDHTGINVPVTMITSVGWNNLVSLFSSKSNIYRYPTGDDWPFTLPATDEEFEEDIGDFCTGREPKFELALDAYTAEPSLQIDMQVDLTRSEVERLLPAPYGVSLGELGSFFKSVYVYHEWEDLSIRFDIRFTPDHDTADWDSGRWLVLDGGRIC
jgi:hypothetical protein